MRLLSLLVPVSAALLTGCMVGPDYAPPVTQEDIRLSDITSVEAGKIDSSLALEVAWWARFNDPVLNALIETAAEANTDIRLAAYRVEEARANRTIAEARRRPFLSGSSSASRQQGSQTAGGFGVPPGSPSAQNLFDLNLNLNWELDLFGRLQRQETAAEARLDASEEERRAVMVMVFAEIGIAYAELRGFQRQYDVSGRNIELATQSVELTQLLVGQGLIPEFDLIRARADVTERVARRHELLAGQRASAARIAFLTGQPPADVMETLLTPGQQIIPSAHIPVGLPSDLLARRPDIRAAERRLAAASEQIGIEMTDLLPRFSLTGAAGLSTANVEDLFDAASQTWSLGSTARWSLFDNGTERAEISIARIRFSAAGTEYDAAILNALAEIETTFSAYVYIAKELDGLTAAQADRERDYDLALIRYQSNTDALFPALDAGLRLTSLYSEIAARQQDLLIAEINVYRALGGGWAAFED
jgi:outer membrane protein, multidrug efflux system